MRLRAKVVEKGFPDAVLAVAEREVDRLAALPPMSPEITVSRTYLDWLLDLPWTETTEDNLDVRNAERVLNENHYGLKKVAVAYAFTMNVSPICTGLIYFTSRLMVGANRSIDNTG